MFFSFFFFFTVVFQLDAVIIFISCRNQPLNIPVFLFYVESELFIMRQSQILIVGAGAAGIAAGTRLMSKGIEDFVILEAELRIGGRIQTVDFGMDY